MAAGIALQISAVQSFVVSRISATLNDRIDGELKVEKVAIYPMNTVILKNVLLTDSHPYSDIRNHSIDTVLQAGFIAARFSITDILGSKRPSIKRLEISDATINLVQEPGDFKTNISRIFAPLKSEKKQKNSSKSFTINKISIQNINFARINYRTDKESRYDSGINWNRLLLNADLNLKKLKFEEGEISVNAEHVTLLEKGGLFLGELSGKLKYGKTESSIEDMHLRDGESDTFISSLRLSYYDRSAFKHFVSDVRMFVEFEQSTIAMSTLSQFAPALKDNPSVFNISSGRISGYVNDLLISHLKFKENLSNLEADMNMYLSGLTETNDFSMGSELKSLSFTAQGLGDFINSWSSESKLDWKHVASGKTFVLKGSIDGPMSNLLFNGNIFSSIGSLQTHFGLKNLIGNKEEGIVINGVLNTDNLDIGAVIGKDFIHQLSLDSDMKLNIKKSDLSASVDSLSVRRMNLHGYDYSGISARGSLVNDVFDGHIDCNDPNMNFVFDGIVSLPKKNEFAEYVFQASIGDADLHAINLDKRENSHISLESINSDFSKNGKDEMEGFINLKGLEFESVSGRHSIGDILVETESNKNKSDISLKSDFAEGVYHGSAFINDFIKEIKQLMLQNNLPSLFTESKSEWSGNYYDLNVKFHDSSNILSFFKPGAYIADSTELNISVNKSGLASGSLTSPRLALKEKYLKSMKLDFDNSDDNLNIYFSSSETNISKKFNLKDSLRLSASDDIINLDVRLKNNTELETSADLSMSADLSASAPGKPAMVAYLKESHLKFDKDSWTIRPASVSLYNNNLKIDSLNISSGVQSIIVNGGISKNDIDTMNVNIQGFDIGILNNFIGKKIAVDGKSTGRILYTTSIEEGSSLLVNLSSTDTRISDLPTGQVRAGAYWNESSDEFSIALRNDLDGQNTIDIHGSFQPKAKGLDMTATLDDFNLGYITPFVSSIFTEIGGKLTGGVSVNGTLSEPKISGKKLDLEDGLMNIAYTKVPYSLNGPIVVDNQGVHFDNISIYDRYEGSGSMNGGILYDNFKDVRMDTRIRLDNMECLNTSESDNPDFFGHIFGSGRMNIYGPFKAITLELDANTVKDGNLHIPIGGNGKSDKTDLLTFKEKEVITYLDPYEKMMMGIEEQKKSGNDMSFKIKINAHNGVETFVDIGNTGNKLNGNGVGNISLDIRPNNGIFNINGDYVLNGGNFKLNALNITNKDFSILDGSSVKFNGNIMDSDLDINARYSVKTSLGSLILDSTSVSTRRNVDCEIKISDKLSNPSLDFSIDIPDLDPSTKTLVESALSTDDKVQKQFIALLVTGNFLPDEQSGIINNTNILYSNMADIMSNQLNTILQKLDIPLDLGLNYQSSTGGNNIFDLALSTQLFNNRVSVNGNIGNRQYMSSKDDDVIGDIDIEIKMDKSGQIRMNMFSHSADQYTNYLDNSQRNGIGIAFQKEFNSFREYLRNIFKSRKKRETGSEIENKEIKTIIID